ncbi:esterase [Actinoplanes ianthinogenes]|uniref:Esterase n=1 Tax=Actinoplanes ianthinogenes TaxID=122358 RepID=A0ABN6CSQ0_9ACTN|nr:trypsin-like serine protease [Actinoplanes ianthinogenes]BCJ48280.1 esterase [Actinoplanes ianthinogenes]GGR07656.1 esterase [Actinoplanes ianthinogenes]
MLRPLLSLLTMVLVVLAGAQPAHAIAYGEDAAEGAWSFSARLTMTGIPTEDHGSRDSWCSGALIAPRWVITAGHCFRDAGGERVGRTVAERTTAVVGGHEVDVAGVRQAETADVALAELAEAITDVAPLTVGDTPPRPGEEVRLTGYGLAGAGDRNPDRLQTGTFVVDRVGDAVVEVSGRRPHRYTSACPHDSGGPYFRTDPPTLVAVVSSGPSCPHEGADLSARTDNLAGWIADTAGGRGGPLDGAWAQPAGVVALLVAAAAGALLWTRRPAKASAAAVAAARPAVANEPVARCRRTG